jgi:HAE1 family hydrophobic/amphiphilic exporter-1
VLLGLAAAGHSVNLSSIMGLFVLLGIAVNNSILLLETYRRRLRAGVGPTAAVFRGSAERLRPVLMTMLTTVAALLPVAIDPWQRSAQSSMASAVVGGLLVSTLLTLFVIPVLFLRRMRDLRMRGQRKVGRR